MSHTQNETKKKITKAEHQLSETFCCEWNSSSCSKCEFSWFTMILFFIVQWIGAYFNLFLIWLILVNFEEAFWKIIHQKCFFIWSLARLGPARPIFLRKIPSSKWNTGLSITSKILILSIFGPCEYHDIRCRWYWQIWQFTELTYHHSAYRCPACHSDVFEVS